METSYLREELNCSICLSLYTDPVSLKCGHNFCRKCIAAALDTQKWSGRYCYFCPECRKQYSEHPQLEKNRKLCNIVDKFRSVEQDKTGIFCTYCDSPVPATKSCLLCEASFCKRHLGRHSKSADHILTEPIKSFEDRKCSTHKEILKYYCTVDGSCICMSCWVAGDHKGHQVELLNEASEKKKEKLKDITEKLNNERQEAEKRIQDLENHKREEKKKTNNISSRVTEMFKDFRTQLDDMEKGILTETSRQEKMISQSVSDLIQHIKTQKDELSRKINEIEDLRKNSDPLTVMKKELSSYELIPRSGDIRDPECLDEGIISQMLHRRLLHLADSLRDSNIKAQFPVMEKLDIILNINTAHNYIILSQDLKSATYTNKPENRPDHPERFTSKQVISTQSFSSGRHYWEVDVSGAKEWLVGVVGHSIERKIDGNESSIGYNDKSWGLTQREKVQAVHNNIWVNTDATSHVPLFKMWENTEAKSPVKFIGIYLDYEASRLSFYQLCNPFRHLHTFTATFTEPLHAAFCLFEDSSIRIM